MTDQPRLPGITSDTPRVPPNILSDYNALIDHLRSLADVMEHERDTPQDEAKYPISFLLANLAEEQLKAARQAARKLWRQASKDTDQ